MLYHRAMEAEARRLARKGAVPPPAVHERPTKRGECRDIPRPCPYVGCRYHLFLTVTDTGSIDLPYGEDVAALESMKETCALDVAERPGGVDPLELAGHFQVTNTAINNAVAMSLGKLGEMRTMKESHPHQTKPYFMLRDDKPLYSTRAYVEARRQVAATFALDDGRQV